MLEYIKLFEAFIKDKEYKQQNIISDIYNPVEKMILPLYKTGDKYLNSKKDIIIFWVSKNIKNNILSEIKDKMNNAYNSNQEDYNKYKSMYDFFNGKNNTKEPKYDKIIKDTILSNKNKVKEIFNYLYNPENERNINFKEETIDSLYNKINKKSDVKKPKQIDIDKKYIEKAEDLIKYKGFIDTEITEKEFVNWVAKCLYIAEVLKYGDGYLDETKLKTIIDYISSPNRNPNTDKINLDQSFEKVYNDSVDWHNNLNATGKIYNEYGKKILEFDDGFYWVDLEKSSCDIEAKAMGHCGTTSANTLLSLREKKKSHIEPHVTIAVDDYDGYNKFYQIKGKENNKPIEKYHKYIYELLKSDLVKKIVFKEEYSPEYDFKISDLDENKFDLSKIYPKLGAKYIIKNGIDKKYVTLNSIHTILDVEEALNYTDIITDKYLSMVVIDDKFYTELTESKYPEICEYDLSPFKYLLSDDTQEHNEYYSSKEELDNIFNGFMHFTYHDFYITKYYDFDIIDYDDGYYNTKKYYTVDLQKNLNEENEVIIKQLISKYAENIDDSDLPEDYISEDFGLDDFKKGYMGAISCLFEINDKISTEIDELFEIIRESVDEIKKFYIAQLFTEKVYDELPINILKHNDKYYYRYKHILSEDGYNDMELKTFDDITNNLEHLIYYEDFDNDFSNIDIILDDEIDSYYMSGEIYDDFNMILNVGLRKLIN